MTERLSLDHGWQFRRISPPETASSWETVSLPHTPFRADLDGRQHWFGECVYRRALRAHAAGEGSRQVLFVGAAMHTATVAIDGLILARHEGGYLPFEVDLTEALRDDAEHQLTISLDNRDHPDVPPGKPYADLDFCWYGGLYREVELRVYPPIHFTDPVAAGEVAGGGLLVRTLEASEERARVSVKAHVRNTTPTARKVIIGVEIFPAGESTAVASAKSPARVAQGNDAFHAELELSVEQPRLWSIETPFLHEVRVSVFDAEGVLLDQKAERVGLRRISFSRSEGFQLNGRRLRLRGTNRHQEMPYVGYALPRAAQYRDAMRIKAAGFDYVRLSHYPQSPHFLDACDELGIVVMNAIPGWQYVGGDAFQNACFQNARDLIRRDRNHPCVVLWELSLNETDMPEEFMSRLHAIGHEELPGDQMFTCGWMDRYDVFIHSRQHGGIHRWENGDKALVVAEYGDWEFYAANEGFDQRTGAGVYDARTHSRQFRADGERGLRQQAFNHQLALNDTLSSPAVLDGQWSMFDYARGYHPTRAACGVMDVFRVPKFSWAFYRSQRDAEEQLPDGLGGPMVFIASHWTPASDLRVWVFSNCDEVELLLDGECIGREKPPRSWMSQYLPHPPFLFELPRFSPGVLEARGFIGGRMCANHRVGTPGTPATLKLVIDDLDVSAKDGEGDIVIAHAEFRDERGFLCIENVDTVVFSIHDAELAGPAETAAEAGIASIVLRLSPIAVRNGCILRARSGSLSATLTVPGVESPKRTRVDPLPVVHPV